MRKFLTFLIIGVLSLFPVIAFGQGSATIAGKVTDVDGNALPGANVVIKSLNLGAATDINGDYTFIVPAKYVQGQQVKITARFIGFQHKTDTINLKPGTIAVDFALAIDILNMDAIVVTGLVDETPRTKLAFSVGRIDEQVLEHAPAVSPENALRGRIAGVKVIKGSGRPGSSASVILRGATSINASGRSNEPLYVIDGIIIDPSVVGSPMNDISGEDIESIEVVKGAAGASLYGSRAANGVINIKMKRGKNLALNQTRIKVRNEFGFNQLPNKLDLTRHHFFKVATTSYSDDKGKSVTPGDFIDANGNWLDPRLDGVRAVDTYTSTAPDGNFDPTGFAFQDNDYKYVATGVTTDADGNFIEPTLLSSPFDQMDRFFDSGAFYSNTISISRNMRSSNFSLSLGNYNEGGILPGLNGQERRSVRISLDHKLSDQLELGMSGYFSQSSFEQENPGSGINPFYAITFMAADADLSLRDEDGELFAAPDPYSVEENPLYALETVDRDDGRKRTMANFRLRYNPVTWFNLEGDFSYDRSDRNNDRYWPIGFQTTSATSTNDGRFRRFTGDDETINGSIIASLNREFGDFGVRMKARSLFERADISNFVGRATQLAVRDVRNLEIGNSEINVITSNIEQIRSEGYSFITALDYKDKYIGDFLIRQDGSSLFGPDERWHTYYRASGAYRLSQESWWPFAGIQEFKLRGSYGTAGGRPRFSARFETWSVSAGILSKQNLGNNDLKPEFSKETEFGMDMTFMDRFTLELTYAKSVVEDQLLFVPLRAYSGYQNQWQNAGTLETSTFEASLNGIIKQSRDFNWIFGINFDRTKQDLTELSSLIPPYVYNSIFFIKEGEELGVMYGDKWLESAGNLPPGIPANQFQVNDDNYLVWVGEGNNYTDGIAKELWGLTSDPITDSNGNDHTYKWGFPVLTENEAGETFLKMGNIIPDFNLGFSNTINWKGLTLFTLFDAQFGGDIYNNTNQWGLREEKLGEVDQSGKSDGLKKPFFYYDELYNTNKRNSHFVEDGTYMKLRELSVRYSFRQNQLGSFFSGFLSNLTIGVVGRNLFTITDYKGYDPEVGSTGGQGGSAVLTRIDAFGYPNFRSFTGILELEF